jgi:hypothetical protein
MMPMTSMMGVNPLLVNFDDYVKTLGYGYGEVEIICSEEVKDRTITFGKDCYEALVDNAPSLVGLPDHNAVEAAKNIDPSGDAGHIVETGDVGEIAEIAPMPQALFAKKMIDLFREEDVLGPVMPVDKSPKFHSLLSQEVKEEKEKTEALDFLVSESFPIKRSEPDLSQSSSSTARGFLDHEPATWVSGRWNDKTATNDTTHEEPESSQPGNLKLSPGWRRDVLCGSLLRAAVEIKRARLDNDIGQIHPAFGYQHMSRSPVMKPTEIIDVFGFDSSSSNGLVSGSSSNMKKKRVTFDEPSVAATQNYGPGPIGNSYDGAASKQKATFDETSFSATQDPDLGATETPYGKLLKERIAIVEGLFPPTTTQGYANRQTQEARQVPVPFPLPAQIQDLSTHQNNDAIGNKDSSRRYSDHLTNRSVSSKFFRPKYFRQGIVFTCEESAFAFLRYIFQGHYGVNDPDFDNNLLTHLELFFIGKTHGIGQLREEAHNQLWLYLVALPPEQRESPYKLVEALKFLYMHKDLEGVDLSIPHKWLVEYCVINFVHHFLYQNSDFYELTKTFKPFVQDMALKNIERQFADNGKLFSC